MLSVGSLPAGRVLGVKGTFNKTWIFFLVQYRGAINKSFLLMTSALYIFTMYAVKKIGKAKAFSLIKKNGVICYGMSL